MKAQLIPLTINGITGLQLHVIAESDQERIQLDGYIRQLETRGVKLWGFGGIGGYPGFDHLSIGSKS